MYALIAIGVAAVLYKPVSRLVNAFFANVPDEHELWPHGADEPLDDYLARTVPLPGSSLDTCQRILAATEAAERARREHPSSRGDA